MTGVLPNDMVVLRVPVLSCRGTTGDRFPRGLDLGEEVGSGGRLTISDIISMTTSAQTTDTQTDHSLDVSI
jgi:hypothetical protein